MRASARNVVISLCVGLLLSCPVAEARATLAPGDSVDIVILRLDHLTYRCKTVHRASQAYRKTLLPGGFVRAGNLYYQHIAANDFGYTRIVSRLTGQLVAHASTVWSGTGAWNYPPDSTFVPTFVELPAPDPVALDFVPLFGASREMFEAAWASARQAKAIRDLAGRGSYEVVIFDHFYTVGGWDPLTAEWIVVAFGHPPAPRDVGVDSFDWPYARISRNGCVSAEASVYNFSDVPESFALRLRVTRGGALESEQALDAVNVLPDARASFVFDRFVPQTSDSLSFAIQIVTPTQGRWSDAFGDNDSVERVVGVVDKPIFRPVTSVPRRGTTMDFDGDGDLDILQDGYVTRLWRHDRDGYVDVTPADTQWIPPYPRAPVAADLNGDGHPDLIMNFFHAPPEVRLGDGTGAFRKPGVTGLEAVTSYYDVAVVDLDRDGDLDLIFQSHGNEAVMMNNGAGVFTDVSAGAGLNDPSQTEDVAIGDVNGDGAPDVFLTNWGVPSHLYVNDGSGSFTEVPGPWPRIYGRRALFLDYDADGDQDIAVLYDEGSRLYRNDGALRFVDVSNEAGFTITGFDADAADLDGDGFPEVVIAGADRHALLWNTAGRFEDRSDLLVDATGRFRMGYSRPQFVDLDSDGALDIYHGAAVYMNRTSSCAPASVTMSQPDSSTPPHTKPGIPPLQTLAYPNPRLVGGPVTLLYRLPYRAHVGVTIMDVQGRRVHNVFQGDAGPGDLVLHWDGKDEAGRQVRSGVYQHAIQIGSRTRLGRIVVIH